MYRNIIFSVCVIIMCIVSSCVTQKACDRKFPDSDSVLVVYKDSIITKHDTVLVPQFEFTFDTTGLIPETVLFHKEVKKKNLTATVDIKKGKLTIKCAEDSLRAIVETQSHIITNFKKEIEIAPPKREYIMHWYDAPSHLLAILFLIYLAFMLGKSFLKK